MTEACELVKIDILYKHPKCRELLEAVTCTTPRRVQRTICNNLSAFTLLLALQPPITTYPAYSTNSPTPRQYVTTQLLPPILPKNSRIQRGRCLLIPRSQRGLQRRNFGRNHPPRHRQLATHSLGSPTAALHVPDHVGTRRAREIALDKDNAWHHAPRIFPREPARAQRNFVLTTG